MNEPKVLIGIGLGIAILLACHRPLDDGSGPMYVSIRPHHDTTTAYTLKVGDSVFLNVDGFPPDGKGGVKEYYKNVFYYYDTARVYIDTATSKAVALAPGVTHVEVRDKADSTGWVNFKLTILAR